MLPLLTLAFASAVLVSACSSTTAVETTERQSSALRTSESTADLSGTWAFVIEASDVAAPLRERCAAKSGGDAARTNACWQEIASESKAEKIRFTKHADGHWVWTSFGPDDAGKEVVYVEAPIELNPDGDGHVLAKISGKATGTRADEYAKAKAHFDRIEVVDARTIAIVDPRKGRLVFVKE